MKISVLAAAIAALSVLGWSAQGEAHSCNGLKSSHCSCTATLGVGGALLASQTDHQACYNQQANIGPGKCLLHCSTALGYLQSASDAALKAAKICGTQTVVMKYSAGTNLPTPWSTQQRFGCPANPNATRATGAGPSEALDRATGAAAEGVKK